MISLRDSSRATERVVFLVSDDAGSGTNPDLYGVFSTREKAQEWIDRQKEQEYPWWESLQIRELPLDEARDLMSSRRSSDHEGE